MSSTNNMDNLSVINLEVSVIVYLKYQLLKNKQANPADDMI